MAFCKGAIDIKGFKLDSNGDVEIVNNKIVMVEGADLKRQTVQQVLNTNKGEWVLNKEEGINFDNIIGKHQSKPKTQENKAMKDYYNSEMNKLKETEKANLQRLADRLEGR